MQDSLSYFLVALALLLAIPVSVFFTEVIASITLPQRDYIGLPSSEHREPVAILVPAHNESASLLRTIADIRSQMRGFDRLLVVADNCTDDTGAVAQAAGAEVISRDDPERRGKGYALHYGLDHLSAVPPKVVIFVDADCRLAHQAIDQLAMVCAATKRPVQALYLMKTPDGSPRWRVAEFAWRVKNWVRPLGLGALGLPCQLMGTGMAFPWDAIRSVNLASGEIVEDLKLGVDLALTGNLPLFCPSTIVTSDFPTSAEGIQSQRVRWEHGHIAMIFATTPRLIYTGIARRNVSLLAMAFDLAVPPLSLLAMLVMCMFSLAAFAAWFGMSWAAAAICTAILAEFVVGILVCWLRYGRDILPVGVVLSMVPYAVRKLPIYRQLFSRKSSLQWVRTDRRKS